MQVKHLGFLGLSKYAIREDGCIFNTSRLEFVKPHLSHGYARYTLWNDEEGMVKHFGHRLVARAFVGGYEDGMIVNHLDSNPQNNHYTNLEWTTHQGNTQHCIKAGRFQFTAKAKKLSPEEVNFIKTTSIGLKQLSEMFGISKSAVLYHRNRKEK